MLAAPTNLFVDRGKGKRQSAQTGCTNMRPITRHNAYTSKELDSGSEIARRSSNKGG